MRWSPRAVCRATCDAVSAQAACGLLGLYDRAVSCDGIRILLRGRDLLVDLPCSGSRGLVGLGVVFAGLAALGGVASFRAGRGVS